MPTFVFRNTKTGEILPWNTISVKRTIMVPTIVDQPLRDAEGNRLPKATLNEVDLEAVEYPDQTDEWIQWKNYTTMYQSIPEAVDRVQTYKDLMDDLGCSYSATTDDVEAAIRVKYTEPQDANEMIARVNAALLNVKVNYQAWAMAAGLDAVIGNDFTTWLHMPLLIAYLPSSNPVEPPYKDPIVLD